MTHPPPVFGEQGCDLLQRHRLGEPREASDIDEQYRRLLAAKTEIRTLGCQALSRLGSKEAGQVRPLARTCDRFLHQPPDVQYQNDLDRRDDSESRKPNARCLNFFRREAEDRPKAVLPNRHQDNCRGAENDDQCKGGNRPRTHAHARVRKKHECDHEAWCCQRIDQGRSGVKEVLGGQVNDERCVYCNINPIQQWAEQLRYHQAYSYKGDRGIGAQQNKVDLVINDIRFKRNREREHEQRHEPPKRGAQLIALLDLRNENIDLGKSAFAECHQCSTRFARRSYRRDRVLGFETTRAIDRPDGTIVPQSTVRHRILAATREGGPTFSDGPLSTHLAYLISVTVMRPFTRSAVNSIA
ncbi:hypothetical protein [Mesorhizobium sp.]|uniref:hypothetical protein n=1 Tax=Mesorhizobium sp. TaxID=1871066 RepID=UPI000FE80FC8|nr:MAG: hypothetical protein EOQ85_28945 [Mesorhizobium sp.]RWH94652.1 MAG: hypothetical protein EOQ89_32670 [Mesorhizobium sp.]TIO41573.1 MAG: hypothetical protein E5X81_26045 [Mesorhizobium sp.]TJV35153.1 MAG: hypothetical protein E5X87_08250 [Mesorhizobium sp.]